MKPLSSALLLRVEKLTSLTHAEQQAVVALESSSRSFRKREPLIKRSPNAGGLAILRSGWATRRAASGDGRTAITHIYGSGDIIGLSDLGLSSTPHEVVMQTDGAASIVESTALGRFAQDHPRLLTILMTLAQVEDIVLRDRFFAATRLPAEERLMHFFLSVQSKVPHQGDHGTDRFPIHLSQKEMGDALGLTDIYVNRLLRSLIKSNAITVERPYIRITDPAHWSERVGFQDRYADLDIGWLQSA